MLTELNGLIIKFAVYTGVLDDLGGKGHAANVVLHLMSEKLNNGHSMYNCTWTIFIIASI